jgi:hypothetical protein
MKSEKPTHNSVVEASPYMNECFVPEIRDEFCALSNKREKNSRHNKVVEYCRRDDINRDGGDSPSM